MARRIARSSTQPNHKTAQRPTASGSQVVTLAAIGFVGALLLFVITGAAAQRTIDREVIVESSQAGFTPEAALAAAPDPAATATPTPVSYTHLTLPTILLV